MAKRKRNEGFISKKGQGARAYFVDNRTGKRIAKKVGELAYKAERDNRGRIYGGKKQRSELVDKVLSQKLKATRANVSMLEQAKDYFKAKKIEAKKIKEFDQSEYQENINYFELGSQLRGVAGTDKKVKFILPGRIKPVILTGSMAAEFGAKLTNIINQNNKPKDGDNKYPVYSISNNDDGSKVVDLSTSQQFEPGPNPDPDETSDLSPLQIENLSVDIEQALDEVTGRDFSSEYLPDEDEGIQDNPFI